MSLKGGVRLTQQPERTTLKAYSTPPQPPSKSVTLYASLVPNSTTRTPATDMLYNTTNGRAHNNSIQLVVQQIHQPTDKNLPHHNILTCRDVELWHCDVANLLYNKLRNCCELVRWWCPLVVLYNMSVAGVHVVEFGTYVWPQAWC